MNKNKGASGPDLKKYKHSMQAFAYPHIQVAAVIVVFLFPAYWFLDIYADTEGASSTLYVRTAASLYYLVVYLLLRHFSQSSKPLLTVYFLSVILAPLFSLAAELQLENGYLLYHNSSMLVIIAVCIIGPYPAVSIPLVITAVFLPDFITYSLIFSGISMPGIPEIKTVLIYSFVNLSAVALAILLVRMEEKNKLNAYISGIEHEKHANFDPLTRLLNRRGLLLEYEHELVRQKRYNKYMGIMMLDIDHFKQVNDTYGHLAGDEVLVRLAELWSDELRETDTLARYGGEEFVVILPETNRTDTLDTAERLRSRTAVSPIQTCSGRLSLTVSIGVTLAGPGGMEFNEAIARADVALYKAKNSGRNRVEYISDTTVVEDNAFRQPASLSDKPDT